MSGYTFTSSKPWHKCTRQQILDGLYMVIEQRDKQIARADKAEAQVERVRELIGLWERWPLAAGFLGPLRAALDPGSRTAPDDEETP
jgi:hypothetical protein